MTSYASAAAFFRDAHGRKVIKRVTGAMTVETWDATLAESLRQLREQGCPEDKIKVDDIGLQYPGGFLMRPKEYAESVGRMTVRSADYIFAAPDGRNIYGDKKGAKVEGSQLVKEYPDGRRITFEIAD